MINRDTEKKPNKPMLRPTRPPVREPPWLLRTHSRGSIASIDHATRRDYGPVRLSSMNLRDIQSRSVCAAGSFTSEVFSLGTTDTNPWSGPGSGFDTYRSLDLIEWEGPIAAFRPSEFFWGRTHLWPECIPARSILHVRILEAHGLSRARNPFFRSAPRPLRTLEPRPNHATRRSGARWHASCRRWRRAMDGLLPRVDATGRRSDQRVQLSDDLRQTVGEPVRFLTVRMVRGART